MKVNSLLALIAMVAALAPAHALAADDDPYAPLKLYQGRWAVTSDQDGKTMTVENRCARTGLFFACEQAVEGKTKALVVFLPDGRTSDGLFYHTQTLTPTAAPPGGWNALTIDGDRWTYAGSHTGKAERERTINLFSGPDRIRFETQESKDGRTWTTKVSGEERRIPGA
ncbi:MAG TPA: hypothetical protein VFC47_10600 [Caulobacteraceae bacterium]|nr:hypothetical protein [Caulobacteraceae bacterium]